MKRAVFLTIAIVLAVEAGGLGGRMGAAAAQDSQSISPEALAQIEALLREKESRTGPQLKMDSQLIYELKMAAGEPVAAGVPSVITDLEHEYRRDLQLGWSAKAVLQCRRHSDHSRRFLIDRRSGATEAGHHSR